MDEKRIGQDSVMSETGKEQAREVASSDTCLAIAPEGTTTRNGNADGNTITDHLNV
jgi:hypothetical protein